jgi:hypothetical protein
MCPACLTTVALIAAGTGSAGGLTALIAKKVVGRIRKPAQPAQTETPDTKENPR